MKINNLNNKFLPETTNSRIFSHITGSASCAIVSSYRGENTDEENLSRSTKLKLEVRKMGYGYIPFVSRWVENQISYDDKSLLIPNCSYEDAIRLGTEYNQSSIIFKEGNKCVEICTNPFENYTPGNIVRTYNVTGKNVMNYKDAEEMFSKRKGGPASMSERSSGRNLSPFHLSEVYEIQEPRPSYFQTKESRTLIYRS